MAFFLSQRSDKGKGHFRVFVQSKYVFCLKKDSNGWFRCFKLADVTYAVNDVPCEAGNAFCDDQIYFSCLAVLDHPDKTVTVLERSAGNAFVSVDINKLPVLFPPDHVFIMVFL